MKSSDLLAPRVARAGSLLHRLQQAPPADTPPHSRLDRLMTFLDDPPPGLRDRWRAGADLCRSWGIACTGASVWRLYRRHVVAWREREAPAASLELGSDRILAFRLFQLLATPQLPPNVFLSVARLAIRQRALEFAQKRHRDRLSDDSRDSLKSFSAELDRSPDARSAFSQVLALLASEDAAPPAASSAAAPA